jgi:hypothetical protein
MLEQQAELCHGIGSLAAAAGNDVAHFWIRRPQNQAHVVVEISSLLCLTFVPGGRPVLQETSLIALVR